jgi:hypothetical protein
LPKLLGEDRVLVAAAEGQVGSHFDPEAFIGLGEQHHFAELRGVQHHVGLGRLDLQHLGVHVRGLELVGDVGHDLVAAFGIGDRLLDFLVGMKAELGLLVHHGDLGNLLARFLHVVEEFEKHDGVVVVGRRDAEEILEAAFGQRRRMRIRRKDRGTSAVRPRSWWAWSPSSDRRR